MKSLSRVRLFATLWTVAHQAPPSMGFSRQEYWSGLPFPSLGVFQTRGSNPGLPRCRQMLLTSEPPGKPYLIIREGDFSVYQFKWKWKSVVSNSLQFHGPFSPWNSPGQNTGMGSLSLLQGIFPTQGSNPDLPHCRQILYQLSDPGSSKFTSLQWLLFQKMNPN